MKTNLPEPECKYGYPREQVKDILVPMNRYLEFNKWFYGQTASICDGREYSYQQKEYVETGCGPHGVVIYSSDLKGFLQGLPVMD